MELAPAILPARLHQDARHSAERASQELLSRFVRIDGELDRARQLAFLEAAGEEVEQARTSDLDTLR
jgi:hypothetical protein